MATALRWRSRFISKCFLLTSRRLSCSSLSQSTPCFLPNALNPRPILNPHLSTFLRSPTSIAPLPRFILRSSSSSSNTNNPTSFDWSDDDDAVELSKTKIKDGAKGNKTLPPPYDPFNKKPVIEEPKDPSNLQEIFHKMRTDGLTNNAIKMFDALSKDGRTHEALELFAVIKDKGNMPDVVAHTAVIEAYANAGGHSKDAIRTFDRMLASGVSPNAYTYAVLIKGLAKDSKLPEARKFLLEMMEKGMQPNAQTYLVVFEAYIREQVIGDARLLLDEMRGKGFRPDEKAVRENLGKRGQLFRAIMNLLFGK
ncbi:pentatricopeptide repeat-containing protein At4g38150-like [Phalaenopsis equestris]|uniref:pentatricopeptide repeat-containing protein At4g38150-like n=1 Tax=Phalaenopsis equestris TaxID=78828 RepID=UPI0009E5E9E0|nr:pentatricopeptide repeat-containing protein At4g38150-like [Phalaenopsis equestris]